MNLHIIIGADEYLVSETAKKIIGDGDGLEIIDSLNSTNAELQLADLRNAEESYFTPPFLFPKKVTWWKNVNFLPGAGGKKVLAEEVKVALEVLAKKMANIELPANQHFIISAPNLLKASIFAKTLAPISEMVVYETGKPWEMMKMAASRAIEAAAGLGMVFAPGVESRFIAIVGIDSRSIISELNKMRSFLGENKKVITADDVDTISSPGGGAVDSEMWSVTDAIGERNIEKALRAIAAFKGESGFEVFMSAVIERFFRQMLEPPAKISPYTAKKNAGFMSNWTRQELRIARALFVRIRERVVSGVSAGEELIETELVHVMRRPPK